MPIHIDIEKDGRSVAVRVTGKLVDPYYKHLVSELDRLILLYRPFTKATIRYFDLADEAEALKWWREPQLERVVAAA